MHWPRSVAKSGLYLKKESWWDLNHHQFIIDLLFRVGLTLTEVAAAAAAAIHFISFHFVCLGIGIGIDFQSTGFFFLIGSVINRFSQIIN
ncbi:hypothetical protein QVD17_29560 [Tagetes erecta]|uniref:Uncharacterized protein n=1 Tax=Tagetes erecta TaxID=13708 RepID=A0AAD8NLD9_TARER|nr:hypothetical protein QVD17_29560 [Tagetes erecta]